MSGADGVVQWIRLGGWPQRHAQPYEVPPPSRGATHDVPPASSRNRRTTNSSMPCPPSDASAPPRSATTHLDLAGRRVGPTSTSTGRARRGRRRCRSGSRSPGAAWSGWPRPRPGRPPGRARSPPPRPRSWPPPARSRPGRARPRRAHRRSASTSPASCSRSATSARSRSSSAVVSRPWSRSGDRLAGDPHRRHPAPQLVSEHGGSVRPTR